MNCKDCGEFWEECKCDETQKKSGSALNNLVIHEYILGLDDNADIDALKHLIGKDFPIRDEGRSWGKTVVVTDRLVVTKISSRIDIESAELTGVQIYSDYYLDGSKRFNAWTSLKSIQNYIRKYADV